MSKFSESVDTFDEFFQETKKTEGTISSLIKTHPVVHHRQTPSTDKQSNIENKKSKEISFQSPTSQTDSRKMKKFLPYIRSKKRLKKPIKKPKTEIEKRLLSAENEQIKKLRSSLGEVRRQLEEEQFENRTLKIIKKREDKALKNYQDQEYDTHKLAFDYTKQITNIKETLVDEREENSQLEKQIQEQDLTLNDQKKRMKYCEKLVNENDLDESDQLDQRLKEMNKKLKKIEEKINSKEKYIENLEKTHRQDIQQEFVKRRELKRELDDQTKKYDDLLKKFDEKSQQIGTMHIYIQRGGRRPSISSINLSKSHSLQSLHDTSPRFREKVLEYDKKRREQEKLKPKPPPLPILPPPRKSPRKKYIPQIPVKTNIVKNQEKLINLENDNFRTKLKSLIRQFSPTKSADEDESFIENIPKKSRSPSIRSIRLSDESLPKISIPKRPLTPESPPLKPKFDLLQSNENKISSIKSPIQRKNSHQLKDILDMDDTNQPTKENENKLSQPSMIMFEPTAISTNNTRSKKTPTRLITSNSYDFDQAVINLHEGKPVATQPASTKTFSDTFDSLFANKTENHLNGRNDTFTTKKDKHDSFESLFTSSTTVKTNSKPAAKIITNTQRPMANRTAVDEIEEFVL